MIKTIAIPVEVCNDIERKMYEYNVARDNIAFLISSNRDDASLLKSVVFQQYLQDEMEKSKVYEAAKLDMINTYTTEEDSSLRWNLNFTTKMLELYE